MKRLGLCLTLLAGACVTPGGRTPGLIAQGWYFCHPAYPNGVEGAQRTILQMNYPYAVSQETRSKQLNRMAAALAGQGIASRGKLWFEFPGQAPSNLWVNATLQASKNVNLPDECYDFFGGGAEDPACDPGDVEYWIQLQVSGQRKGWYFNMFGPRSSRPGQALESIDGLVGRAGSYLVTGWSCNSDGTIR